MDACAVLHITALLGGGVDRHVRDIARDARRRHVIWHTAQTADAVEVPADRRVLALDARAVDADPERVARWLRHEGVGVLHVHSLTAAARDRARTLAHALGVRFIATLHDVLFLRADGFDADDPIAPDAKWLADTSAFLHDAAAVIAPSDYLAQLAREHVAGLDVRIVPNGSRGGRSAARAVAARPEFSTRGARRVAAVLGAIGPHKGSRVLEALGEHLAASDIAIVVIGYLDAQVVPGWHGEHLFVHGPYDDADVPGLLRAYGARIALFPNRVPESFSYALSDVWSAGLPALVTDAGALGERVRRHGGGWILPHDADAAAIAQALRERLADGDGERARVESELARADDARVPALDTMTRSLDALYARFGLDAAAPVDPESPAVRELLATNLDGALFRHELTRMADEFVQLREAFDAERERARRFEEESRGWIAKLEGDVASLQAELRTEVEQRRVLGEENGRLNAQLAAIRADFERLPRWLRVLLKKLRDARG